MTDDQIASVSFTIASLAVLAGIIWLFRKGQPWYAILLILLEIPLCMGVWFFTFFHMTRLF